MLMTSLSTYSPTSANQIVVKYDRFDDSGSDDSGKFTKKLSKVKKFQKCKKSAKAIGSEEPSFLTSNIRLAFTKMYKTHDRELLANVGAFKIWKRFPKGYKHVVLVLPKHQVFF